MITDGAQCFDLLLGDARSTSKLNAFLFAVDFNLGMNLEMIGILFGLVAMILVCTGIVVGSYLVGAPF